MAKHTFFVYLWNTYEDVHLVDNANLNKFKRTNIIQSVFSNHNAIKLQPTSKDNKKIPKHTEVKQYTS